MSPSPPYFYGSHYAQAYYPQASAVPHTPICASQTTAPFMSTWYQPGSTRCSHPRCKFMGSNRSVEIHMMDRHLVYPLGWHKRRMAEWDADPSLKGKHIPIQGTNIILNTPEVIDVWIAERKNRFPSSARVEEKKRKLEEAVARGQLDIQGTRPQKRLRATRGGPEHGQSPSPGIRTGRLPVPQNHYGYPQMDVAKQNSTDDEVPEELPSKIPEGTVADAMSHPPPSARRPPEQPRKPQPKGPPKNPFASRPTLLRNLLLPEIRMTVSNLSQAIHFLVENDFLNNVELKPGQADEQRKIHVLT